MKEKIIIKKYSRFECIIDYLYFLFLYADTLAPTFSDSDILAPVCLK